LTDYSEKSIRSAYVSLIGGILAWGCLIAYYPLKWGSYTINSDQYWDYGFKAYHEFTGLFIGIIAIVAGLRGAYLSETKKIRWRSYLGVTVSLTYVFWFLTSLALIYYNYRIRGG